MISRAHFISTIGYDGPAAVVDTHARRQYAALSTRELAERGLFRAAYASAVYAGSREERQVVADIYNQVAGTSYTADSGLDRLFGVLTPETEITRILAL